VLPGTGQDLFTDALLYCRAALYIDGLKVVDNDGNEYPDRRQCSTSSIQNGPHVLYIEGWSKSVPLYLSATLQGPDTKNAAASFSVLQFPPESANKSSLSVSQDGEKTITYITVAVVLGTAAAVGAAYVAFQMGYLTHAANVPGLPAIYMQMTLNMNLQDIKNMDLFKTQLASDIAKSLNLNTWQVQILSLRPGSIIVDFVIRSQLNKKDVIEKGAANLKEQLHDPSSRLMKGQFTRMAVAMEQMPDPEPIETVRLKFDPSKEEAHAGTTSLVFGKSSLDKIKAGLAGYCLRKCNVLHC
jgi:hypothetical protein